MSAVRSIEPTGLAPVVLLEPHSFLRTEWTPLTGRLSVTSSRLPCLTSCPRGGLAPPPYPSFGCSALSQGPATCISLLPSISVAFQSAGRAPSRPLVSLFVTRNHDHHNHHHTTFTVRSHYHTDHKQQLLHILRGRTQATRKTTPLLNACDTLTSPVLLEPATTNQPDRCSLVTESSSASAAAIGPSVAFHIGSGLDFLRLYTPPLGTSLGIPPSLFLARSSILNSSSYHFSSQTWDPRLSTTALLVPPPQFESI